MRSDDRTAMTDSPPPPLTASDQLKAEDIQPADLHKHISLVSAHIPSTLAACIPLFPLT